MFVSFNFWFHLIVNYVWGPHIRLALFILKGWNKKSIASIKYIKNIDKDNIIRMTRPLTASNCIYSHSFHLRAVFKLTSSRSTFNIWSNGCNNVLYSFEYILLKMIEMASFPFYFSLFFAFSTIQLWSKRLQNIFKNRWSRLWENYNRGKNAYEVHFTMSQEQICWLLIWPVKGKTSFL